MTPGSIRPGSLGPGSLGDVYLEQVQDLYSACGQAHALARELGQAATQPELRAALGDGFEGIATGMAELAALCGRHGVATGTRHCKGMESIVAEASTHVLEAGPASDEVRDAVIVTAYQRMAHYAIAGYGCLLAFARRLDLADDVPILERCLDACHDADRRFTDLAGGSE